MDEKRTQAIVDAVWQLAETMKAAGLLGPVEIKLKREDDFRELLKLLKCRFVEGYVTKSVFEGSAMEVPLFGIRIFTEAEVPEAPYLSKKPIKYKDLPPGWPYSDKRDG